MEETRRRIVQAALEMHDTVGPAATTISAIAERAGVERLTVYRHFPDADSLFQACIERYTSANPAPDPRPWRRIRDPEARLLVGLTELYAFYRRTESMSANSLRDAPGLAPTVPVVGRWLEGFGRYLSEIRDLMAVGWRARGRRRATLLATIGHAVSFHTWRSLVRDQGLDDEGAADLMAGFVRCAAAGRVS